MATNWTLGEVTEYDLLLRLQVDKKKPALDPKPDSNEPKASVLHRWLESVRSRHPETTRHAHIAEQSEHWLRLSLILFSLLSGAGAAAALLRYRGDQLINVSAYLGILIGVQLLLLLGLGISMLMFQRKLPSLYQTLLPRVVRESQGLHALPAWRWRLFTTFQQAGIAFNLGVILCTLWKVLTFDLAFGWATTLQVDGDTFHRLVTALSAPWGGRFTPTPEQIEASRISLQFQLTGVDPQAAASWWPFLVMCVVFYGWLPRVILMILGRVQLQSALRNPPFHHPASERLYQSLVRENLTFSGTTPDPGSRPAGKPGPLPALAPSGPVQVIVPDEALPAERQETWLNRVSDRLELSFTSNPTEAAGVMMVMEAWQPPLEETLRHLRDLRSEKGVDADLLILLVGAPLPDHPDEFEAPEQPDIDAWTQRLTELHDPHLGLLVWQEETS